MSITVKLHQYRTNKPDLVSWYLGMYAALAWPAPEAMSSSELVAALILAYPEIRREVCYLYQECDGVTTSTILNTVLNTYHKERRHIEVSLADIDNVIKENNFSKNDPTSHIKLAVILRQRAMELLRDKIDAIFEDSYVDDLQIHNSTLDGHHYYDTIQKRSRMVHGVDIAKHWNSEWGYYIMKHSASTNYFIQYNVTEQSLQTGVFMTLEELNMEHINLPQCPEQMRDMIIKDLVRLGLRKEG